MCVLYKNMLYLCFKQNKLFVLLLFFWHVSSCMRGLGFNAQVHHLDNKLAIISIKKLSNTISEKKN